MPLNMPEDEEENDEGLAHDGSQDSYDNLLMFYTSQMFLGKKLNQVHKEMYGDQCLTQTLAQVGEMLRGHESILRYWRETLPPNLRWNDDDPPPSDILQARLRG